MADTRILKRVLICCAALFLSTTPAWPTQASFEDGVRAYLAKDYAAALNAWRPLANQGHAPSQFSMGLSYENGRGVERDPTQAAIWYHKAAEQGLADAQFNLGNLYLNGLGVPKNSVEAVRWFRRASEQDMPHAQVNLGYSYETGSGVAQDPVKAVHWYRRAAAQNIPQAQYYLGAAYEQGSGVEVDLLVATDWYQLAADQGITPAAKRLIALRQDGVGSTSVPVSKGSSVKEVLPRRIEYSPTELQSPALAEETPQTKQSKLKVPNAVPVPEMAGASQRVGTLKGNYRLRLASYRKPVNANRGWKILARKHPNLLANFNYAITKVNLGEGKGIYYRLEAGPVRSYGEANAICTKIKLSGDSCVVVRP